MHHQLIHHGQGARTWAVVLDTGDEVNACLLDFARREVLAATSFTAIGAFQDAVLGYFEWERREYRRNTFDRQLEVVSLIGDIALQDGKPQLHMHAVLGDRDGTALGGHLLEGHVRPTLEVILTETPAHLHKEYDADAGLALIKLDGGSS
ncbi:DNA-binding protein [Dyella jejuensis]|uniref:DNA-binding protein n=1 Tax=Dyella jejuensis TaxID=1432009 RepID=A0ABW8JIK1_9GAMM